MVKHGTGNWQRRVEKTESLRREAKLRKQKYDVKRHYKIWAEEFLSLLGRHRDRLKHRYFKLHVWTDTLPADEEDLFWMNEGRKKRSSSLGNVPRSPVVNGRRRSHSNADAKKVHPRSKESIQEKNLSDEPQVWMCRSHFFTGQCSELSSRGSGRKSGGCRYVHTSSSSIQITTLCQVLSNSATARGKSTAKEELKNAEQAVKTFIDADKTSGPPSAMDMVFYLGIPLNPDTGSNDDADLCSWITGWLASKHLKLANIVYMVLDEVLVFDRYRDGSIYESERDYLIALLGDGSELSTEESVCCTGDEKEAAMATPRDLPGTILEHILTFLPDAAAASTSRVCKAWHHEIGKNSPNLWKHMLDRRRWPHLCFSGELKQTVPNGTYRDQFLEHYSVIRDVAAIKSGMYAIADHRTAARTSEQEMAFQDFSVRKNTPSFPNCCVGLQEWSPNRMLVAYHNDCSLRLFETIPKPGDSGEIQCREIICQRVDPYRYTRRRRCTMVSMRLDEECIGCLCHVTADNPRIKAEAYILVVMSRGDFLLGESSGVVSTQPSADDMQNVTVIDVGEAVLNYLLSSDVRDYRLLQLIDFLSHGGHVGEVEVLASQSFAACGYGRFMVEVSIAIPVEDEDENSSMNMIERRLFLLSASVGAVVWMGESNPLSHELRPRGEEMILAYIRRPHRESGSRAACFLAVGTLTSPAIMVGEIEPTGTVRGLQLLEASLLVRNEIENDDWQVYNSGIRPIIVTPSDVVVADTMERRGQGAENKIIVSFFSRHFSSVEPRYGTLALEGNMQPLGMSCIRDEHVILVCRCLPTLQQQPARENEDEVFGRFDEQRFVGANDALDARTENDNADASSASARCARVVAVVIHVSSRQEISRVALLEGLSPDDASAPEIIADCRETVGAGLTWKGVVMTGYDVRSVLGERTVVVLDEAAAKSSRKKKRQPIRDGKKDGFARGMSLRG